MWLGSLIGGTLSGIGNVVGTAMSNNQSRQNIALNARYQQQLADQEFAHNLQLWNMTNQYNSPASQMQRFKDAGLNPHLIYGKGDSGNAGSISYQRPDTDLRFQPRSVQFGELFNGISNAIGTLLNLKRLDTDTRKVDSDISVNQARINEINQNVVNKQVDNLLKHLDYNQKRSLFPYQMDMLKQQISNLQLDNVLKDLTSSQKMAEISRYRDYGILPSDPPLWKMINLGGRDLLRAMSGWFGGNSDRPFLSNKWFDYFLNPIKSFVPSK